MRYLYLAKKDLGPFVDSLMKNYKVVAPTKKENLFVFAEIENADEISLDYIPTIVPPKKYFFPQKEKLGSFNLGDVKMTETSIEMTPTVIFAAHTCDIDGMECLDHVFSTSPADPYYMRRKKSIVVIGYECMKPCDKHATCVTMDTHVPKAGYDIMITDAKDKYVIHINSTKGDEIIKGNKLFKEVDGEAKALLKELREEKKKNFNVNLTAKFRELEGIFEKSYKSKVWEDVGKRCVSCGNCTAVCPTCYCFDMYDKVDLDLTKGTRERMWDSCQLEEFAEVAGGENFREERSSRQRHRYYRKFDYPVKKFNKFFCTGCGRCTRSCVADIKLSETVNDLTKECKGE